PLPAAVGSALAARGPALRATAAIDRPVSGSSTVSATSETTRFSVGTADAAKLWPDTELSTFTYATACAARSRSCCSPHSVDEVNVNSSASQLASTIVRFGFMPCFASAPSDRASSISDADPLDGSTPPYTHASRWLPAAGQRGPAGGQRIARHEEVVHDAAALNVALGSPRSIRIRLPLLEPIVCRIGVDQDAGGAAPLGRQRLEAAIAVRHRIPHQD